MIKAKNKVFCLDCGKRKLLFSSEKKAETFMKFNNPGFLASDGKAMARAYFCPSCCGWHVTSKKAQPRKTMTEKVLELYENEKSMEQKMIEEMLEKVENNKFTYIGLFLTEESRERLLGSIEIPLGSHTYADHCTLLFARTQKDHENAGKVKLAYRNSLINKVKSQRMTITHIGCNGKAVAVKVSLRGLACCNDTPHITVCTMNGGKPFDSNSITVWKELPTPMKVKATWKVVP